MISFTILQTQTQDFISDTDSATLTRVKRWINDGVRDLRVKLGGSFVLEDQYTDTLVDGTQYYDLPTDYKKVKNVSVEISDIVYRPQHVQDPDYWRALNVNTAHEGSPPTHYFIRYLNMVPQIGFYPEPSTASDTNGVVIEYIVNPRDLVTSDASITAAGFVNGDATVTDSEFTAAQVGLWLLPDVATGGDGNWYKIASVVASTSCELNRKYEGSTDTSVTCTVAEIPLLPAGMHYLIPHYASAMYFLSKRNTEQANIHLGIYNRGAAEQIRDWKDKGTSAITRSRGSALPDPNYPPRGLTSS